MTRRLLVAAAAAAVTCGIAAPGIAAAQTVTDPTSPATTTSTSAPATTTTTPATTSTGVTLPPVCVNITIGAAVLCVPPGHPAPPYRFPRQEPATVTASCPEAQQAAVNDRVARRNADLADDQVTAAQTQLNTDTAGNAAAATITADKQRLELAEARQRAAARAVNDADHRAHDANRACTGSTATAPTTSTVATTTAAPADSTTSPRNLTSVIPTQDDGTHATTSGSEVTQVPAGSAQTGATT